jgi:hypothetical protein
MKRILMTLLALVAAAGPLVAHGKGRLKLGSNRLTAGGTVELTGTEFAKNELFAVLLVGAAGRTRVGEVRADSAGKFTITITLPADVAPGSYRIAMEASDDDLVATADVQVAAGTAVAADDHPHDDGAAHEHSGEDAAPSTEPLALERARSPVVTGGALAGIIAALAVGTLLLRKNGVA